MKNRIGFVVVIGVLAVAIFLLTFNWRSKLSPATTNETHTALSSTASPTATATAKKIPAAAASPDDEGKRLPPPPTTTAPGAAISSAATAALISAAPEFTNLPPATVMENLRTVFRSYQSMFRDNPVGTNPEITHALDGGNRKQAHFLSEEDGLRINARGELIDPWGTPFFFHQLSGTEMEIHSAGPDRVMWTSDDLVIK